MKDLLNILIIEDSPQDFLILKEYINRVESFDADLTHCESLGDAEIMLNNQTFDLIFLDLFLADSFGRNSFLRLKQIESFTPIIVLSGLTDKGIALEIVQLGAQEYIVKGDFDELLIEKAIIYSIERYRFQKKIEQSEKRYRLTFKNAGVALGEYEASGLYQYIQRKKAKGAKSPKEISLNTLDEAMKIRAMLTVEDINQETLRLFQMESKEDFEQNYEKLHSEHSIVIFEKLVESVWYERDSFKVIAQYRSMNGNTLVLLCRVTLYGYNEGYCKMIMSGTDISTLVKKEHLIARQIDLAESLSNSTMVLLEDGEDQLKNALEIQGETLKVDSISLIQIDEKSKNLVLKTNQRWAKDKQHISDDFQWLYETPLGETGVVTLINRLKKKEFIRVDSIDEIKNLPFKELLIKAGIKSLLISPVFVKNKFWSAVLYINYEEEKIWRDEELITVKSFSNSIGSFIARNKAEKGLIELNEELENRIEQRTEDLTEAMAELESFSYSVSHDLRAPLRKVGGFSQILEKEYGGDLPDRAKHLLNNIKDGANEMSELIHDLLEFSKLGRHPISFSNVNMNDLSNEIISNTVQMYPHLNINFKIGELKNAQGDRNLIKHAMSNLIWNAVKFSSKNEKIEIEIDCKEEEHSANYSIKDNGIGINMDYAHKIFNVFQRLHTKDEYEGTGVGLAIVKRIVKKHNGQVKVNGELGKGTTFTFSLPTSKQSISHLPEKTKIVSPLTVTNPVT